MIAAPAPGYPEPSRTHCAVWWKSAAPFNGQHAIAADGRDGYVFTRAHTDWFCTQAQRVEPDGSVRATRTAPAYLGMAGPTTTWVPVNAEPAVVTGDLTVDQAMALFERADRLYAAEVRGWNPNTCALDDRQAPGDGRHQRHLQMPPHERPTGTG